MVWCNRRFYSLTHTCPLSHKWTHWNINKFSSGGNTLHSHLVGEFTAKSTCELLVIYWAHACKFKCSFNIVFWSSIFSLVVLILSPNLLIGYKNHQYSPQIWEKPQSPVNWSVLTNFVNLWPYTLRPLYILPPNL